MDAFLIQIILSSWQDIWASVYQSLIHWMWWLLKRLQIAAFISNSWFEKVGSTFHAIIPRSYLWWISKTLNFWKTMTSFASWIPVLTLLQLALLLFRFPPVTCISAVSRASLLLAGLSKNYHGSHRTFVPLLHNGKHKCLSNLWGFFSHKAYLKTDLHVILTTLELWHVRYSMQIWKEMNIWTRTILWRLLLDTTKLQKK